ncbi:MAG: DNA topoisomerase IV [Flavobacteriaceae bacterium]
MVLLKRFLVSSLLFFLLGCNLPERNCLDYKNGDFEFSTVINDQVITSKFSRRDSIEIEYFENKIDTSFVNWVSDCEFILRKKNPATSADKKAVNMKILSTSENGYIFEFSIVGDKKNIFRGEAIKHN